MALPDVEETDIGHVAHHDALHIRHNNSVEVRSGDTASRPAAASVDPGTLYIDTDTDQLFRSDGAAWTEIGDGVGVTDHGALTGLGDNDHPHYALASNLADHNSAADPHTGYRLESADHNHQSTGAEAGKLDHGAALNGLSDDDHPQYAINFPVTWNKSGELEVTTDTGAHRFYLEGNHTIAHVQISVGVAPTGSSVIVDVHVDGTTVFTTQSNRPEIAVSGFFDASGTIDDPDHDDGQYVTVNIDQIGSTLPGENLTVIVWFKRR